MGKVTEIEGLQRQAMLFSGDLEPQSTWRRAWTNRRITARADAGIKILPCSEYNRTEYMDMIVERRRRTDKVSQNKLYTGMGLWYANNKCLRSAWGYTAVLR